MKSDYGKPARQGWSRSYEEAWDRLQAKKENKMTNTEKAQKYFQQELNLIKNQEIKQFVLDVFEKLTPDYFWTVPCSTSGKYHPKISLGVGGLIRHVKLAVWWGLELAKAMEMEQYQDEMVAALLLHDLIKNGEGLDVNGYPLERGVTGTHGVDLAGYLSDDGYEGKPLKDWEEKIIFGIASHMGIWTVPAAHQPKNMPEDLRPFIDLIHLADYCASRKVDDKMVALMNVVIEKPIERPKL